MGLLEAFVRNRLDEAGAPKGLELLLEARQLPRFERPKVRASRETFIVSAGSSGSEFVFERGGKSAKWIVDSHDLKVVLKEKFDHQRGNVSVKASKKVFDALVDRVRGNDEELALEWAGVSPKVVMVAPLPPGALEPLSRVLSLEEIDCRGEDLSVEGPAHGIGAVLGDFSQVRELEIKGVVWLFNQGSWNQELKAFGTGIVRLYVWLADEERWSFHCPEVWEER